MGWGEVVVMSDLKPVSVGFLETPSVYKIQYTKVPCFQVACPEPHHLWHF